MKGNWSFPESESGSECNTHDREGTWERIDQAEGNSRVIKAEIKFTRTHVWNDRIRDGKIACRFSNFPRYKNVFLTFSTKQIVLSPWPGFEEIPR